MNLRLVLRSPRDSDSRTNNPASGGRDLWRGDSQQRASGRCSGDDGPGRPRRSLETCWPWLAPLGPAARRRRETGTDSGQANCRSQLWGKTKTRILHFGWKPNAPRYFSRDNPGEAIETEGWFCDLFIFGIHDETDQARIDHADPSQWAFMVIPTTDLEEKTRSMQLSKARSKWPSVGWEQLGQAVEGCIRALPCFHSETTLSRSSA